MKNLFARLVNYICDKIQPPFKRALPGEPFYGDTQHTDLQHLCLYALEDMTLKELNKKYFDDGGIGYTKKVITGQANPVKFIQEAYAKRFPKKYHKKLADHHRVCEGMKGTW